MKYLSFIFLTLLISVSCKSDKAAENSPDTATSTAYASQDPMVQNTITLLQGTWNSRDDKNTSITFKNNTRVETVTGKPQGKIRYFEIADLCNNDTAKGEKIIKAKAKYISMQDIDMCYYIKKITPSELVLSYVGRNNTLRYVKDNAPKRSISTQGKPEIKSTKAKEKILISNQ